MGPRGPQGLVGPRGTEGSRGFPGKDGRAGDRGPEGRQGPEGKRGPKGERGLAGAAGRDGSLNLQFGVDPSDVSDTSFAGSSLRGSPSDHVHKGVHSVAKSGESPIFGDV